MIVQVLPESMQEKEYQMGTIMVIKVTREELGDLRKQRPSAVWVSATRGKGTVHIAKISH